MTLRFSDAQIEAIGRAAKPIRQADRSTFLKDLAAALEGHGTRDVPHDQFARALLKVQYAFRESSGEW
jgi:hypothetical protein